MVVATGLAPAGAIWVIGATDLDYVGVIVVTAAATEARALAMAIMALIMARKSIVAMGAAVGTVAGTTTGANSEDVSGNVSGGFSIDPAYRLVGVLGSALRWPLFIGAFL